jgi:predicted Zn-dependent protease
VIRYTGAPSRRAPWQVEAAITHYIEAGAAIEAINAALAARQYHRAAQLVQDTLHDADAARPFWRKLAAVYAARGAMEDAEKMFLKVRARRSMRASCVRRHLPRASVLQGGDGRSCVDMYFQAGKFDAAYRVAKACMSEQQMNALFNAQVRVVSVSLPH